MRFHVAAALLAQFYASSVAGQVSPQEIVAMHRDSLAFVKVVVTRENGLTDSWTGTGIIVSSKGHVLTNRHVAPRSGEYPKVQMTVSVGSRFGQSYPATFVKGDDDLDLALLKIPDMPTLWKPLDLAKAGNAEVGDKVVVMGYPLDLDLTVVDGLVSSQSLPGDRWQTSAPLNPGNSGGPVFDMNGKIVAIVSGGRPEAAAVGSVIPMKHVLGFVPASLSRPTQRVIEIRSVTYGYGPDKMCDPQKVKRMIQDQCDGDEACSIVVQNDKCPPTDPAPYLRKKMVVIFRCSGDRRSTTQEGLDDTTIELACKQ